MWNSCSVNGYALVHLPILDCEVGMDRKHGCIERYEFIDISPIFLETNLDELFKDLDYLKIKNFNLVSHVPFICFLKAINWI